MEKYKQQRKMNWIQNKKQTNMKRLLFLISMLMTCVGYINADEIFVPEIVIPKGGTAALDIQLNNERQIRTEVQFLVTLPEGITLVHNSSKIGERFNGMAVAPGDTPEGNNQWTVMISAAGATDAPIPGNSGTLVAVDLLADESIEKGTELNGYLEVTDMNLISGGSIVDDIQSKVNFKITIGEPSDGRTILDETSTTAPVTATDVDVRVKRTVAADKWSTICLPFSMTETQTKEAFGNDVLLADFTGVETTKTGDDNITGIKVNFSNASEIEANHPYLIKVSEAISEFTVEGVDVAPEEIPSVDRDEKSVKVGKNTFLLYNSFIGTYVAETTIPEMTLFLSDNKFWYSTGMTKTKGFRAYFDFYDVLTDVQGADVRIFVSIDDEETKVEGLSASDTQETIYDLGGRKLDDVPQKGVYIVNGKKVLK